MAFRDSFRATGPWVCKNCRWCGSTFAPGFAEQTLPVRILSGRSGTGPYEKPNPFRSRRPSEPHLSPATTKARFQPGEETPKGCCKLSGSGDRTETSQLSHPRLCVDRQGGLIGGPRKMGVQGGASISDGAKPHSICGSPLAVLWLLSARADLQCKCNSK